MTTTWELRSKVLESANPFAQTLGPLNQPQAMAPIGGGLLGNTVQNFLVDRGLGGLSADELRARGVSGALVGRGGGGARGRGRGLAPFLENEERFGGRFKGEF